MYFRARGRLQLLFCSSAVGCAQGHAAALGSAQWDSTMEDARGPGRPGVASASPQAHVSSSESLGGSLVTLLVAEENWSCRNAVASSVQALRHGVRPRMPGQRLLRPEGLVPLGAAEAGASLRSLRPYTLSRSEEVNLDEGKWGISARSSPERARVGFSTPRRFERCSLRGWCRGGWRPTR